MHSAQSKNESSSLAELSQAVKLAAFAAGFDDAGIAPAHRPEALDHFDAWLAAGYAGNMGYMANRRAAHEHPEFILGGTKSVLVLVTHYHTGPPPTVDSKQGKIARYAWGRDDYHRVIRRMLKALNSTLRELLPGTRTRGIVDTAPLFERQFAQAAGLGWIGKNTLLLSRRAGSLFFLSAILLDRELAYDLPTLTNHCGNCRACLDVCPTDAFVQPGVLDASKCVSYLTIEHREAVPRPLREKMDGWIFGCDECQNVCPWNRHAPSTLIDEFQPATGGAVDLIELLQLSEAAFDARFGNTPLSRPGRGCVLHSAAIALSRAADEADVIAALEAALADADPLVRIGAAWSLGRSSLRQAREALHCRVKAEWDPDVLEEMEAALEGGGDS